MRQKTQKLKKSEENVLWFKDLNKKDISLVGGKAANLGEMFNKFPVPNGFCITVKAYQWFLKENNLAEKIFSALKGLDVNNTEQLGRVSGQINRLITRARIPKQLQREIIENYEKLKQGFVAVRSSATAEDLPTASFAGQQATFLNVKGVRNVLKAVKKCWASLFSQRAIYYRVVNNFDHTKVFIAVVIQEMVNADKAGVMFTANPVSKDKNELIIEASYGLGEAVVSGIVTPDSYIVQKKGLRIKSKVVNEKNIAIVRDGRTGKNKTIKVSKRKAISECLSKDQVLKLASIGLSIEKHYKQPMDVEWAIDREGKVYVLQARPITTL